jgi:hypothetical protein
MRFGFGEKKVPPKAEEGPSAEWSVGGQAQFEIFDPNGVLDKIQGILPLVTRLGLTTREEFFRLIRDFNTQHPVTKEGLYNAAMIGSADGRKIDVKLYRNGTYSISGSFPEPPPNWLSGRQEDK